MRFKKFLSCLLVSSLVNSGFVWSMPGKDPALVALEERTQAGWQKFKHLQQRIIEVTGAKEKTDNSSTNLKESMAKMSGPFMGNYLISQEMARTILSIDEVGDVKKEFATGTSPVKNVENVFFKTDGRHFNPQKPMLSPALENAAYWFYHIMFGEGVTPTSLITVNNVLIKRAPFSLFDKFPDLYKKYNMERFNGKGYSYFFEKSIKEGVAKTVLDEFKNSFEDSYESFIIQASLGAGSEGLDDFIKKMIQDPQKFNELNKKSLSIHFLASMLLNLSDAKEDNFRVDNGVIIGIDNDRFFAPDIFRQCSHQEGEHSPYILCSSAIHRVGARSIFYCWKDVLNMPLDASIKSMVTSINPFISISQWLYQLHFYDNEYNRLKDVGALGNEWFEIPEFENLDEGTKNMIKLNLISHSSIFPVSLPQHAITSMIHRLEGLFSILKFSRKVSHKASHKVILEFVQPHIADFYFKVMEREPNINCHEIMGRIYEKYGSNYEDLELTENLKDNFMEDISIYGLTSTSVLLNEIVKQIHLNQYPINEQISIINSLGKVSSKINILQEAFHKSWIAENLLFKLIEQGLTHEGLKLLITIGHKINQTDENNQNLVHKVVLSYKLDLDNAEKLLESLKEFGANLDLKARGRTEQAGTPLTQAMLLAEPLAIPMFNKLIELGAGFDTNYFAAEGFINKNEDRLSKDLKFKQRVETLLRRDPKLHWQLSLNKLLPISSDPKAKGVIIKTSNSQERFLSSELEKTMLDKKGNLASQTTYGRRDVASIKTSDGLYSLYFKSFPELPGVEEQVGRLTRNLLGFGAPHTELVRYKNIPVLLSQAIMGENLQDVLSKDPDILRRLDAKNLSGMILLSILVNPEDGKPDNFIVEPVPGQEEKYRLVCVDNDHAFVPAVAKEQKLNWTRTHDVIQVRSVLYCLDQMNEPIHQDIRDLFIKLDPAELLKKWLNELKNVHEMYTMLFNANEMRDHFKNKECFLGVPFKENVVPELYQKFLRLKDAIEENENITHLDLLMKLEPMLGKRYIQVLSKPMTVKERFDEVDGVFYSKAMNGAHGTVINSKQVLKSMQIPTKITVIEDLRAGRCYGVQQAITQLKEAEAQQMERALYLQAIQTGGISAFKNLRLPKVLEEVLKKTDFSKLSINSEQAFIKLLKENKLEQIRSLHLLRSNLLMDEDLRHNVLGIGNLTLLDIRGCSNLTQDIFYQISQECPGIRKLLAAGIGNKNGPVREIGNNKIFIKESVKFVYLERLNISDLPELTSIRITAPKLTILEANNCNKLNLSDDNQLKIPKIERIELRNNSWINDDNIFNILLSMPYIETCILEMCPNINDTSKYKDIKNLYNGIFNELGINEDDKETKIELEKKQLKTIQVVAISSLTKLTSLKLSGSLINNGNITDKGAKSFSFLTNLTFLNLDYNQIGVEAAKSISSLTNLASLSLWENQIGDSGAKSLSSLTNLTYLNLTNNQIGAKGVKFIASLTNLTSLHLAMDPIGNNGLKYIASLTNLTNLFLYDSKIGAAGVKYISSLTNLTSLALGSSNIGDEGAKYISSFVNLTFLTLVGANIGNRGAKFLSSLTNLTVLNLRANEIGDEGAKSLFFLTKLTSLDLDSNNVGREIMKKLKSMVEQNEAKAYPNEDNETANATTISKNNEAPLIKKSIQCNCNIIHHNMQINLKTMNYLTHEIKEEDFNKINFTKSELLTLSLNVIQQNIDLIKIAGRQIQTLLNYYNQANQELGNTIRRINPYVASSKGHTLSQAQALMPQIGTNFIITPEERKILESKIKQMFEVMDLLNHYLENNSNVCRSIILYTLKHFNQALYKEDGSLDEDFFNLYSKVTQKPLFIWKEDSSNENKSLELVYSVSADSDPRCGSNFFYNPADDSLTPLEVNRL